ncbi:hypothetical protein [Roseomonas rosulenta]|uniref:hypothetical protein n=1 Tax=Roseomonas rosulenta TaxID=2748667 RepID=UPI001E2D9E80|nr:hypothetical protein [Roseomonas rosulenta]
MDDVTFESQADAEGTDRSAIIMMLTYVEAECRRLGDAEAAHHAALAAALITGQQAAPTVEPGPRRCLPVAAPLN